MEIVPLTCPNCGAPLQGTDGQNLLKCAYCGYAFSLENAGNLPREQENNSEKNKLQLARKSLGNNMYDRAYELYNEVLLADPDNVEADVYSQFLYMKTHLKNFKEFNMEGLSGKAVNFVKHLTESAMPDDEQYNAINKLVSLLNDFALELGLYITDHIEFADDIYKDAFGCRYVILDIVDELWKIYPDEERYKEIYIFQWRFQLLYIKNRERIARVKEQLHQCGIDEESISFRNNKLAYEEEKPITGCLWMVAGIIVAFLGLVVVMGLLACIAAGIFMLLVS